MVIEDDDEFNLNMGNLSRSLDDVLGLHESAQGSDGGVWCLRIGFRLSTFTSSGESNVNIDIQAVQSYASSNRNYKLWYVPED